MARPLRLELKKNQSYLGLEQIVERMQGLIDPARPLLQEIPASQRCSLAKLLKHRAALYAERDRAIAEALPYRCL